MSRGNLQGLHGWGYAVVETVVTGDRCAELLGILPEVASSGTRTLLEREPFIALAATLRENPILNDALQALVAVQCTYFRKSQEHNWLVAPHRDLTLPIAGDGPWPSAGTKEGLSFVKPPRAFLDRCLAARLHLDGSPEGDLDLVPGSHRTDTVSARTDAVPVTVNRGGALLMRPTIVHASRKLDRAENRRVLHYVFGPRELPTGHIWHYSV